MTLRQQFEEETGKNLQKLGKEWYQEFYIEWLEKRVERLEKEKQDLFDNQSEPCEECGRSIM